jgi:hypothetical protein
VTGEEIVVAVMAVGWIIAIVRGVRRMDAQEGYRSRRDALARITQEERHG